MLNKEITCDPEIPLLSITQKIEHIYPQINFYMNVIAELFKVTENWRQHKYPPSD